ncbi:hypothetical protein Kpho02_72390 [Kitasatospora phosalacinea]|uniref:Uncharacterized protein n=1 Tax=Kitasatospora phosalacinea TaxID=2065 RepID=A0A9W6V766_9ACTN|nr:hypothetical protein [Kitasatospora phosalacinea]GLW74942.1 hypothetical protein Kpho02_72390 [Kitasatospora phosalacinea]
MAAKEANETAKQANATADAVAAIERARWHHDLTPQLAVTITPAGVGAEQAYLRLTFEGPASLERLDEVEIIIRDDGYSRPPSPTGSPTQEEIDAQVWGPYRFRPGIDQASADGRSVPPAAVELGEWRQLLLERTRSPQWQGPNSDDH